MGRRLQTGTRTCSLKGTRPDPASGTARMGIRDLETWEGGTELFAWRCHRSLACSRSCRWTRRRTHPRQPRRPKNGRNLRTGMGPSFGGQASLCEYSCRPPGFGDKTTVSRKKKRHWCLGRQVEPRTNAAIAQVRLLYCVCVLRACLSTRQVCNEYFCCLPPRLAQGCLSDSASHVIILITQASC